MDASTEVATNALVIKLLLFVKGMFIGMVFAFIGGILMAAIEHKTRKETAIIGTVAIASSMLFGTTAVMWLDHHFTWIDMAHSSLDDQIAFIATVHGLIGACSWSVVSAVALLLRRIKEDPIKFVQDIKGIFIK